MTGRHVLRAAELLQADVADVRAAVMNLPAQIRADVSAVPPGVLLTLEHRGRWFDLRPRRRLLARLERRIAAVAAQTSRTTVVGAAIARNGQVIAAQRCHPPALAGKWEFPGGKVELGETPAAALIRECREELGVAITVGPELGRVPLPTGASLIVYWAELAGTDQQPRPLEHAELRWCDSLELATLDWLDTNRGLARQAIAKLEALQR